MMWMNGAFHSGKTESWLFAETLTILGTFKPQKGGLLKYRRRRRKPKNKRMRKRKRPPPRTKISKDSEHKSKGVVPQKALILLFDWYGDCLPQWFFSEISSLEAKTMRDLDIFYRLGNDSFCGDNILVEWGIYLSSPSL